MGAIALFITFPYNEENEEKEKENEVEKDNTKNNDKLKEALLSTKNLMMISFCFCGF